MSDSIYFVEGNICECSIPDCDLLIVRDCLFHLSFGDIDMFLNNLSKTNYKFLLTSTHICPKDYSNTDILTGDFRLINLFEFPFNFSRDSILDTIRDCPENSAIQKEMVLYSKSDVPQKLAKY